MTQVGYMEYFKFPTSLRSELLESILLEWSSTVIHPCQMCCIDFILQFAVFCGEWRVLIMLMADMVDFPIPNCLPREKCENSMPRL